ncbi:MAG: tetratricopeptide repeat protein [Candidatus Eisenbacteria bacterium]
MRSGDRTTSIARLSALALLVVAVGLRVLTIQSFAGDLRMQDPILDARYYLDLAARLSVGQGWPPGPIFMSPLFPWLLSGLFHFASATPLTVHLALAFLGLATLTLLVATVRRDFGSGPAWCAACLFVLFGPILAMEGQILTESLLLLLGVAAIRLWPRDQTNPAWSDFLFGVVTGLLTIGRGVYLLLAAVAVAALGAKRRWLRGGLVLVGAIIALLPLAVRQTQTSGHFSILTMNGGMNLYLGNNRTARGIYSLPPEVDLEKDPTAARSASIAVGRNLTLAESDRYWRDRAIGALRADPARAAWLMGRKALLFFSPKEIPQIEDFQVLAGAHWPLRVAFLRFGWVLPLAVLGAAFALRGDRARSTAWLALIGIGFVSTLLFFATGRYRIPVMGGFLGLAGVGLHQLWQMRRGVTPRQWVLLPIAVALVQFLFPTYSESKAQAFDAYQLGLRYQRQGRLEQAIASMESATRLEPEDATNWHGLGAALVRAGRVPQAIAAYQRAVAIDPQVAATHYNLAIVLARGGQERLALDEFRAALAIDPLDPAVRSDYGVALARTGAVEDAVAQWQEALRIAPGYEPAARALAAVRGTPGSPAR